jgi:amino-acid N-acetyltransferase
MMRTVRAETRDWPAVQALLSDSGLPLDGAAIAFTTGVVVRRDDRVIGCAAIEPYDGVALLRSIAVAADQRGAGIGTNLVQAVEDLARERGARSLILLTETADGWFRRLGYSTIDRSAVPTDVAGSIEFEIACSTSAVAMARDIT